MKLNNPFIVTGRYVSEEYFCDRVDETRQLAANIINWRNTVLVSPRRMGKSGLIEHTFAQKEIRENYETFYIDIFATNSLEEFVFLLSKEITSRLQKTGRKLIDRFFTVVNSLQASFSIDPVSGRPDFTISIGDIHESGRTLEQVFEFLETNERPCVVAIDEFQQIADYPGGKQLIATLRTLVQQCRQTRFIFAGSNRRMMGQLFNSPSEPFYMSCSPLYLDAIAHEGKVEGITSAQFVKKHSLASASAVQGAAKTLIENETLVREDGRYHISNRFFSLWLARRY